MKRLIFLLPLLVLACGVVPLAQAPAAPPLPTVTATKTAIKTVTVSLASAATPTHRTVYVSGCWNLRQRAGGAADDAICNDYIEVTDEVVGGWVKTPRGWLCVWAFDAAEKDEDECRIN